MTKYYILRKSRPHYLLLILVCFASAITHGQQINLEDVKQIRLEEATQLGINNNRQLKIANTDVAIANENVSQSKIARVPRIGLTIDYNYIGNPKIYEGFFERSTTFDYLDYQATAGLYASMPLYNGGIITSKINQQQLLSDRQKAVVKMTEAEIKITIIEQYFTLEKLYQQIEVTKQNIVNTDLRIKQLQSRVANGQNLKSDLLRTEMQQSRFQVAVFQSTNDIKLVSNYLAILIGLPPDTILKPDVSEALLVTEEVDLQKSLSEAYKNRVEIQQSELGVKVSESALSITKSGYKPNVNASLLVNSKYPAQWPDFANNTVNFWAAGVSLNWDISSFYNLKHRITGDKLQIDKSNTALEATKDKINSEVKSSFVRFAESKKNITTFQKDIELSLSNYKIVKSRYDNDFALISDMVDAELQVNEAKISLINANLDLIIQYYSLQYAMGKL